MWVIAALVSAFFSGVTSVLAKGPLKESHS